MVVGQQHSALSRTPYYVLTGGLAIIFLFPLLWSFYASISPQANTAQLNGFGFGNYKTMFDFGAGLPTVAANSAVISILTVAITLTISTLGGYAFARFKFWGKDALFLLTLYYVDFQLVFASGRKLGLAFALSLVASGFWHLVRTWAWAWCFKRPAGVSFARLARVRLAAEAFSYLTLRGIAGEPLKIVLLADDVDPPGSGREIRGIKDHHRVGLRAGDICLDRRAGEDHVAWLVVGAQRGDDVHRREVDDDEVGRARCGDVALAHPDGRAVGALGQADVEPPGLGRDHGDGPGRPGW